MWWAVARGFGALLLKEPIAVAAVVIAGVSFWHTMRVDRARRQPGLAVRLVTSDVFIVGTIAGMTVMSGEVTVATGGKVPAPAPPAPARPPERLPAQDRASGHNVLHLLVRNLSERPGGIVDFKLLRADGSEVSIDKREYRNRLALPVVLPA